MQPGQWPNQQPPAQVPTPQVPPSQVIQPHYGQQPTQQQPQSPLQPLAHLLQIPPSIPLHPAYSTQNIVYVQVQQRAGRSKKFWLWVAGGISVFFIIMILALGLIIWALLPPPEFGYRLDVSSSTYEDLGANRAPYLTDEGYPDFSTTVTVSYFGSGVLIGDRWVLTAGHVVLDKEYGEEQPGDWVVSVGTDYEIPDATYEVKRIFVHPGWRADFSDIGLEYGIDIALIELYSPVLGVTPALWANSTTVDSGSLDALVYSSGFGDYTGELDDGYGDYYSQRRAWANTLDRLSFGLDLPTDYAGDDEWMGGLVIYDFDSPDGDSNSLEKGKNTDGLFSYVGSGDSDSVALPLEGTSVPGDSGGPTYLKVDGEWVVIAVTSHGSTDGYYGDIAVNTRVSTSAGWICSVAGEELAGC